MYENENNETQYDSTASQGHGTYTDYVGYGNTQSSSDKGPEKKKGKGKAVVGCAALVMAGVLAGGGVSYAFLSSSHDGKADSKKEADADSKGAADKEEDTKVELQKSDDAKESTNEKKATAKTASLQTTGSDSEMSVSEIADKCLSSVVAITNKGETEVRSMWGNFTQDTTSEGSGVIIGETDDELLILTNYHVVEDAKQLSVVFSWEEGEQNADDADITEAVVKDYDADRDIAVISIKMDDLSQTTKDKITVATVGSSDSLGLGDQVVAIGNALGYGQSVTTGIVSALNRTVTASSETDTSKTTTNKYIQTDAAINPGNSGGALFNMKGELVGINSAKAGGSTVEGVGYAIPISDIMNDVENMMNQETRTEVDEEDRGYLGITIVDVTSEISSTYGIPQGAYISSISDGSAAEKAGLEKEQIITAVNGKTVSSSSELKEYLAFYAVGDTVTVTVAYRDDSGYSEKDVDVVLGENPDADEASSDSGNDENSETDSDERQNENGEQEYGYTLPFSFGY